MISLRSRVHLDASSDRVWACFCEMDKHYHDWIPEHLRWRWLSGEPLAVGAIWHADEWVGPMRIDSRFQVTKSQPGRFFAWRILGFPASFVRTRGSFHFSAGRDGGCDVVHEVHLGFALPVFGRLLDLAMQLFLPIDEFRRHVREEGDNLARIVEAPA